MDPSLIVSIGALIVSTLTIIIAFRKFRDGNIANKRSNVIVELRAEVDSLRRRLVECEERARDYGARITKLQSENMELLRQVLSRRRD